MEIINDLYEDVKLRQTRKEIEKQVNDKLNKFVKNGAILGFNDKRLIVFKAVMLYCNNKKDPTIYHFLFWPIFDTEVKNNSVDVCDPILVNCDSWKYRDDRFIFHQISGQRFKFAKIDNVENKRKFVHWKQAIISCEFPLLSFVNSRIGELKIEYRNRVSCTKTETCT